MADAAWGTRLLKRQRPASLLLLSGGCREWASSEAEHLDGKHQDLPTCPTCLPGALAWGVTGVRCEPGFEPCANPLLTAIMEVGRYLLVRVILAAVCVLCLVTQSCPTFLDPMDFSPPGSFVHGILQARTLEWVAQPSSFPSQGSNPGFPHCRRILYRLSHQGSRGTQI